jgi:hypothetical protein
MEYILTCLFYLKQIICVSYRMKEEQHIDTIKNYNYNDNYKYIFIILTNTE